MTGTQTPNTSLPGKLEHLALQVKGIPLSLIPKPIIVMVKVEGQCCQALLDTGSMGDFVSTTLADQLKLKLVELKEPLVLQLVISGSQEKVKYHTEVAFEYQEVQGKHMFNIMNLDSHDVILGLPFMIQQCAQVSIQSEEPQPLLHDQGWPLSSSSELIEYASNICKEAVDTPLPPLHAINHVIPLLDDMKAYLWCPSKCPEALKPL
ncbi:hypothetical protein P691DRAFT_794197 [Macrolepiota fuliginosa MF-IS2]|uniref:Uncharacterized protein n=1 Tax=Macrolepiota fuliginosa MF-IS2 TaxID=1400762 RepID=A0A9P5WX80_9AGAR|nr:hypothetical protein P691DRAFT_794197 [Macrolepiota fuliginosa MF-IS2]